MAASAGALAARKLRSVNPASLEVVGSVIAAGRAQRVARHPEADSLRASAPTASYDIAQESIPVPLLRHGISRPVSRSMGRR